MQAELKELWKVKRPDVTRRVAQAAAMGDRSENAEYIYGKKQLREIDARIRFLAKRLDALEVVHRAPSDQTKVYFGAWVTLQEMGGETHTFRLVGPDEFDRGSGFISIDAPMARALLGRSVGDEISVNDRRFEVLQIGYGENPRRISPVGA